MAASIEIVEGIASHVSRGANVHGHISTSGITGKTSGSISSANVYTFRVNGRPVEFNTQDALSLADGDAVCVAGIVKKGHLHCHALKNLNTQAEHTNYHSMTELVGCGVILFGVLTLIILVGFVMLPLGVLIVRAERRKKKCIEMVAIRAGKPK